MTHEKILREGVATEMHKHTVRYARELVHILDSFAHCDDCVDEWAEAHANDNTIHDLATLVSTSREWARE